MGSVLAAGVITPLAVTAGTADAPETGTTAGTAAAPVIEKAAPPEAKAEAPPAAGARPYGVDVSHHDKGFDWSRQKPGFGIAKATEGTAHKDTTFTRNWTQIKQNSLVRGAYHYGRPQNDPVREADHYLRVVTSAGLAKGDLLILDLETTDGRSTREVNDWAKRWLERVEQKTGVKPMFYSSRSFAEEHGKGLGEYPLWVAHYGRSPGKVSAPSPWKQWTIHQYAATDHDHNVSRLSADQLRQLGYKAA
ncbi:glycoside hydrolase family 25 protein [Actinomadura sp. 3N508]|uniref:glycoside hydrolase family 25 protein n=1 Tax=Actinomadura sp. 3N508 TaxID=3375153 RepID=UPI00378FC9F8